VEGWPVWKERIYLARVDRARHVQSWRRIVLLLFASCVSEVEDDGELESEFAMLGFC
jgi:hypothetical protein